MHTRKKLMKYIVVIVFLSSCISLVGTFTQNVGADLGDECELWHNMCSDAYSLVYYYCYSGEIYDPAQCDNAYAAMGYACWMSQLCNQLGMG